MAARGTIYDASYECRERLMECMDFPWLAKDEWSKKRLADFNLWASGSGALAQKRASLDEKLASRPADASVIRDLLVLLSSLIKVCQNDGLSSESGEYPKIHTVENEATSQLKESSEAHYNDDTGSGDSDRPSLKEALSDVETIIEQLVRISVAISQSSKRGHLERADYSFDPDRYSELEQHLKVLCLVSTMKSHEGQKSNIDVLSRLGDLGEVQHRLIQANLRRRHRFLYANRRWQKRAQERDANISGTLSPDSEQQPREKQELHGPLVDQSYLDTEEPKPEVHDHDQPQEPARPPAITTTHPTSIEGPIHVAEKSPPTATVASSTSLKIEYPRPPKVDEGSLSFRCPCCCQTLPVAYSRNRRWRKHLAEDLSPYVCVLQDCTFSNRLYASKREWITHIETEHTSSEYWLCSACLEPSKHLSEAGFASHLTSKHSATISPDQVSCFTSACLCKEPQPLESCPLCPPKSPRSTAQIDSVSDISHIAEHVHSFSLNSVPWAEPGVKERDYLGHSRPDSPLEYFADSSGGSSTPLVHSQSSASGYSQPFASDYSQPFALYSRLHDLKSQNSPEHLTDKVAHYLKTLHEEGYSNPTASSQSIIEAGQKEVISEKKVDQLLASSDLEIAQNQNTREQPPKLKILIGVDFGTEFSRLAYVDTLNPHNKVVISQWGPGTPTADKAPTILAYDNRGITGPFKWGYQVGSATKRHEWFKLGLGPKAQLRNLELADEYPSETAYPPLSAKESEKLVVDYLTSLRKRAEEYLRGIFPSGLMRDTPVEYIITVPAIWTDKAQFKTRSCAEKAGMGRRDTIQIVSEPEAAGMYAMESMPTLSLGVNDTFVVCDAGGGTVDLVSYTVKAREPSPAVVEAAPGSGGLCGSIFLNRLFNKWIEKRFEKHKQWFEEGYHSHVTDWFEKEIKSSFWGNDDDVYETKVRGLSDNSKLGITDRTFRITGKDLRVEVFDPIIERVQRLVLDQIGNTREEVRKVLLCGGFGQSDYLKKRLQDVVGGNIEVLQVPNSNTAIVRGALVRGLSENVSDSRYPNARVDSRMARRHFGICCWEEYDPKIHEESRRQARIFLLPNEFVADFTSREYHSFTGRGRVKTMQWFVQKGESVKKNEPKTFGYYYETPVTAGWTKTVDSEVFACDDDKAPLYKTSDVKQIVKLNIDLSSIPNDEMIVHGQSGNNTHYKVDFDVEMILDSAKLSFSMFYKGKRHGTVHADFD